VFTNSCDEHSKLPNIHSISPSSCSICASLDVVEDVVVDDGEGRESGEEEEEVDAHISAKSELLMVCFKDLDDEKLDISSKSCLASTALLLYPSVVVCR